MGFFDFFRRKKTPALPEGTKDSATLSTPKSTEFDKAIRVNLNNLQPTFESNNLFLDPNSQTQVFSSNRSGSVAYTFSRNNISGLRIDLAEFNGTDFQQHGREYLRNLVNLIDHTLETVFDADTNTLSRAKLSAKAKLEALQHNHPGLVLNDKIFEIIDNIKCDILRLSSSLIENECIDYKKLDSAIPKTIDIAGCSEVEIRFLGDVLNNRLKALDEIQSPEDAYERKYSISGFLKSREAPHPVDKVLALLGNDVKESEFPIILKCAQALEEQPNEDGLLYSAYLKLEEKRILNQIQQEIAEYQNSFDTSDVNYATAQEQINYLESLKPKPYPNSNEHSSLDRFGVIDFMIKTIQGVSLESYISYGMKYDTALKSYLQQIPIEHSQEALTYVGSRMTSFGQVSDIPDENRKSVYPTLRNFIETTDCKTQENQDSKEFLLIMAQTEKSYILRHYAPILEQYKKITKNLSHSKDSLS